MLKCIGIWNVEFHIPIPIPEFWNVECGSVLLRISHSTMLKCIGIWNMECGNPHSNFCSRILECGMWTCVFENISLLTMLKCIGMWNVECGLVFLKMSHSKHAKVHWNVECAMWKSTFHIPHSRILEWELECGFPHSKFHIPMHFSEARHSEEDNPNSNSKIHIPYSTFQCILARRDILKKTIPIPIPEFWNLEFGIVFFRMSHLAKMYWNVEYGMWKSTFHIPHSKILEW